MRTWMGIACTVLLGAQAAAAPPEVQLQVWTREACARPPCPAGAPPEAARVRARLVVGDAPVEEQCRSLLDAGLQDDTGHRYPVERIAVAAMATATQPPAPAPAKEWIAAALVRANADALCAAALEGRVAEAMFPVPAGHEGPFQVSLQPPAPPIAPPVAPPGPAPRLLAPRLDAAPPRAVVVPSVEPATAAPIERRPSEEALEEARRDAAARAKADYDAGYRAGRAYGRDAPGSFCWAGAGFCASPVAVIAAAVVPPGPAGSPPRGSDAWQAGWRNGVAAGTNELRLRSIAGGTAVALVIGALALFAVYD